VDDLYKPYHKQALDLQFRFHDSINDPTHPMAHVLSTEIHELTNDIQEGKHPRQIDDRIKIIQNQLMQARAQGEQVLNYSHNQDLHHRYEYMRNGFHNMPHY
jgi:hypothetical protein